MLTGIVWWFLIYCHNLFVALLQSILTTPTTFTITVVNLSIPVLFEIIHAFERVATNFYLILLLTFYPTINITVPVKPPTYSNLNSTTHLTAAIFRAHSHFILTPNSLDLTSFQIQSISVVLTPTFSNLITCHPNASRSTLATQPPSYQLPSTS